jgi:hypothetical protein
VRLTVGRDAGSDLLLNHCAISRRQGAIRYDALTETLALTPLAATNVALVLGGMPYSAGDAPPPRSARGPGPVRAHPPARAARRPLRPV